MKIPREAGHSRRWSWADPRPLWESRNQIIADLWGDPTHHHRERWLESLGLGPQDPLLVDTFAGRSLVSFLVMGDTGEGDTAQYRVARTLLEQGKDTDFLFICSDVIYPSGGIEEYGPKLLGPYREYPRPDLCDSRKPRLVRRRRRFHVLVLQCDRPAAPARAAIQPPHASVYGGGPRKAV